MKKAAIEVAVPINFRSTWAIPFLIAGVIALVIANEVSYQQSIRATSVLENTVKTRLAVRSLTDLAIDARTQQRGYLLTGDETYLITHRSRIAKSDATIDALRLQLGDQELKQLEAVSRIFARMAIEMNVVLEVRKKALAALHSIADIDPSKASVDELREVTLRLTESLDNRVAASQAQVLQTLVISRFSIGISALLSVVAFLLYLRQSLRLASTEQAVQQRLRTERDSLEQQVAQRTGELSQLANHLETAREDERAHLARELHDELGALLTAAKLDVSRLRARLQPTPLEVGTRIDHLSRLLTDCVVLKRSIVEGMRPSSLSHLGLLPTLEIFASDSAAQTGLRIETQLEHVDLDDATQLTIYRFVQESLTNITKYASAKNVLIELLSMKQYAQLSVKDDGEGFDPLAVKRSSYGLTAMRQRVEAAGGRMEVRSTLGAGTLMLAWLPQRQSTKSLPIVDDARVSAGPR